MIESSCGPRATVLVRHLTVEDVPTAPWFGAEVRVEARSWDAQAARCPCVALSPATAGEVGDFLLEQGYPESEVAKIVGGNVLRVLRSLLPPAATS